MDVKRHFTIEWIDNGAILRVQLFKPLVERAAIDAFVEQLIPIISQWEVGKPYLSVYELHPITGIWSPYLRQRAEELVKALPDHAKGRVATVMNRGLLVQVVRLFLEAYMNRRLQHVRGRIFFDYDEALAWLREFNNL